MTAPPDLPCRDVVELLTEHLEGALDADTEDRLVQHLASCTGCEDHLEQVQVVVRLSGALPAAAVPAGLAGRLAAAFRSRQP